MWLLLCLCLGLSLFSARPALAQDFAAAGQHFAAAQDAFAQGQYKQAAEEYQAAYDITKDGALLFNIGESWQRAGDAPKALAAYRAYLKDQPGGAERAEVEKRVQGLEADPAAATRTVTPEQLQQMNQANQAAGAPAGSTLQNQNAQNAQNGAQVAQKPPEKNPQPVPIVPSGPAPKPTRMRTAAWISVAVAVALATAGAILGLGAQNRADELQRRTTVLVNNQPPVYDSNQAEAYNSLVSEGHAYNTASIALLSVAGAALVTGGALFIADWARVPKGEKSRLAERLRPALSLGNGQGILAVGGSF